MQFSLGGREIGHGDSLAPPTESALSARRCRPVRREQLKALRKESREVFERVLEQLDASDREILLLRDVEGLSGEEVAAILGITIAAMKTRLHRARLRLASKVREAYEPAR